MEFKISTDALKEGLNRILSVVDKRNSRPILTYTQIRLSPGKMELVATDLEVSAKVILNGDISESTQFCINAKNLFDILRELPSGEITGKIEENKQTLQIFFGDIHYSLLVYPANDFPHLIFGTSSNVFSLTSEQLSEIISKTSHAISTDDTRLFLNGIFLQEIEEKLRAVATDGHRLSLLETDLENATIDNLSNGIIIPRKGVFELKRLTDSFPKTQINISVDESFIYAAAGEENYISVRLIAREYPKYQAVIPNKTQFAMRVDRNIFLDAVRRVKIMSNEKSHGVRVALTQDEMTISAQHPSLGDATEKLSIEYDGKELEIGFNAKYILETLTNIDEGEVTLELNNEVSPVLIAENLPNYLGIIMPLKL